jgi:hypothetical protein
MKLLDALQAAGFDIVAEGDDFVLLEGKAEKTCSWWNDSMQKLYDAAVPLDRVYIAHQSLACCPKARRVHCVCEVSFLCPEHGGQCHGSHE